ncbi:MAG: site-specific integrase [Lachnospiraceae bacterium]|nr:site-specific integrase [Lachnospiraceae bacterium]
MTTRKDNKNRSLHKGETQRTDGTYMYRYTDPKTGKRPAVYARDLPELRAKEKEIMKALDDDILTDSAAKKLTLDSLFDRYLEIKMISVSTQAVYRRLWNQHIKDSIGSMKVIQLRQSHICSLYADMSRNGYANKTITLVHAILHAVLEIAVNDDIIRKNVVKGAMSSNYGQVPKEKNVLSLEQQKNLLAFVRESGIYNVYLPMLTIMLGTGLRCGELIGLTWNDVDIENGELSVNHQLIYQDMGNGYKFYATTPKTDSGIRTIPLTETVCKAFEAQRKQNDMLNRQFTGDIDGYTDFIFLTQNNTVQMPRLLNKILYNLINAYNRAEQEKAGQEHRTADLLPKISAHCLRHTACTNMARQNMNIKALQYIMGHAHSSITMDIYNHVASKEDVRNEMERYGKATDTFYTTA